MKHSRKCLEDLQLIDASACSIRAGQAELEDWLRGYAVAHRHRLADDLRMVRAEAAPDARIIEFGTSPPILTVALHRAGYNIRGVDIDPERFTVEDAGGPPRIDRVNFELDPLPFPDESFEVALFNEIFEHLRINPIQTLREVRRVLVRGGTLLLSTPNMRSLRGLWMLLAKHRSCHIGPDLFAEYDKLERFGHMGHVREYTAREVKEFLERVGFRVRRIVRRDYGPPVRRSPGVTSLAGIERAICFVKPSLRPLFSLICERGEPR